MSGCMKAYLFLGLSLLAAAASNGCQENDPAGTEAPAAKLADDMSTRPASRRWFWWGGDPEPTAPGANPKAAPGGSAPPAANG